MVASIDALPVSKRVLRIAVVAPGGAAPTDPKDPTDSAFTQFGGDDIRRGAGAWNVADTPAVEEKQGFALVQSFELSGRKSGNLNASFRDNPLTGPLFWGDRIGWRVYYQDMLEGIGAGKPLSYGTVKITELRHAMTAQGFLDWAVTAQASADLTPPTDIDQT